MCRVISSPAYMAIYIYMCRTMSSPAYMTIYIYIYIHV